MVIRQRAIQAEDKQERHHAILDAAARLLARSPDRIANMADVADEAGLAKGTSRLRVTLSAAHTDGEIDQLLSELGALKRNVK